MVNLSMIEKGLAWVSGLGAAAVGSATAATGLLPANVAATLTGVGLVLVAVERYVTDGTQPTVYTNKPNPPEPVAPVAPVAPALPADLAERVAAAVTQAIAPAADVKVTP